MLFRGGIALTFAVGLAGCSPQPSLLPVTTPGVVQTSSPEPIENLPEQPQITVLKDEPLRVDLRSLDSSSRTLRVRVFPILTVPSSQEPYPISVNPNQITLYNSKGLEVVDVVQSSSIAVAKKITLNAITQTLELDGVLYALRAVAIFPQDKSITTTVKWNSNTVKIEYRGDFKFEITSFKVGGLTEMRWSVVNYVLLEDYVQSVTPSEMPSGFQNEALKTHAVAARTYALFHSWYARNVVRRSWDVDPTTSYQSYRGALVENLKVTENVRATTGQVVTVNGKLIEAFFSSNSGGMLCSVSECFGGEDRSYAVTKPDVEGVREKPGGRWSVIVTPEGIHARLARMQIEGDLEPDDIAGLEELDVGEAGRVHKVQVVLKTGQRVPLSSSASTQMRWQFKMQTNYYELSEVSASQVVQGYGLGHGVGMSQWGAQVMAQRGSCYREILSFYYLGTSIYQL